MGDRRDTGPDRSRRAKSGSPGRRTGVPFSTYICHPALANDNLSGVVLLWALARTLAPSISPTPTASSGFRDSGPLCWLDRNDGRLERVEHGLVVSCVGDPGPLRFKRSRRGDTTVDRGPRRSWPAAGEHRLRLEPRGRRRAPVLLARLRPARRGVFAHTSRALSRVSLERRQSRTRNAERGCRELPGRSRRSSM